MKFYIKTKQKLLEEMASKPAPVKLLRDLKTGVLYSLHYLGMGDSCAIDSSVNEDLVARLLQDGIVTETDRLIGAQEMRFVDLENNRVEAVATPKMVRGYAIELTAYGQAIKAAGEVFANEIDAELWLKEPCRALGDRTPISMLESEEGLDDVIRELHRLQHGIVS